MRNYGYIATAIWVDPDFRRLTGDAQRLYFLLITQADISSVGTLPIRLRRWAGMADGSTTERLSDDLAELEAARFVVLDWDQEELLVRTFVRWDGGHTNPKRLTAIKATAKGITSPILAAALAAEFDSLGINHDLVKPQVDSHSIADRSPSDPPRVVVALGSQVPNPQPTTNNKQPATPSNTIANRPEAEHSSATPMVRTRNPDAEFDEFWKLYPRKVGKDDARRVFAGMIRKKRATPAEIITGAARLASDPNLPGPDRKSFIPHPSTWLHRAGWEDEPLAPDPAVTAPTKPSTTDSRVMAGLDLADQLRAEEQAANTPRRLEIAQ